MKKISNFKLQISNRKGQALVTLLFISVIGITIAVAAAVFIFQNIQASTVTEQGVDAYYVAEAGIEEGLLRTIRNASYSGTLPGQPLTVGGGSVVISTGSGGIITAVGTYNNSVRKIQVKTVYNNGILQISSWKEIK
jgi:hypothetical protein